MKNLLPAINLKQWVDDNRHLLKPPVGNKAIVHDDYIVMIVGGPNSRKDYHINHTPEFFYQIEGDIVVKIIHDGEQRDIHIREGEIFYLPASIPHSPQRGPNTIGMVIEQKRPEGVEDALAWFCEKCHNELYQEPFELKNIEVDLPVIFDHFYSDEEKRTCAKCGAVMAPPAKV
jgi:3-hydroxyanthranilate 3,4-dioxygenase